MTQEATCKYCRRRFTYTFKLQRKVEREVCDSCRSSRRRWARKRVRRIGSGKRRRLRARRKVVRRMRISAKDFVKERDRLELEPGEFLPLGTLAEKLGMTVAEVFRIEEQALKKLRGSTPLQEAYGKFKQDGKPMLDLFVEQLGEQMRARDEARLMALQHELVTMWQRHDAWDEVGRQDQVAREAAVEIRAEIEKCRTALLRELGKVPFVEV